MKKYKEKRGEKHVDCDDEWYVQRLLRKAKHNYAMNNYDRVGEKH